MRRSVAVLAIVMTVFVGCSPSAPSAEPPATGGQATAAPTGTSSQSAVAAEPKVLVWTRAAEFAPILHTVNAGGNAYAVLYLVFNTLVKLDSHDPNSGNLLPDLATSWEGSADATTYTLTLRDDVTWHDGEPFTARDVAFTANWTAQNFPEAYANAFQPSWTQVEGADSVHGTTNAMSGIEVLDDTTIRITLSAPNGEFLKSLSEAQNVILPEHVLKDVPAGEVETSTFATASPVGTGPYRAVRIERDIVELEANDEYFKGRPNIDKIIYQTLTPEATIAQLESGELGLALRVDSLERERLSQNPNLQVIASPEAGYQRIEFRTDGDIFGDKRVRQAFAFAIDRQGILDAVLEGNGRALFLPPGFTEYEDIERYAYDPARAKQLLDEAGFDYSKTVRFLYPNDIPSVPDLAPIIQQQLQDVGVTVELMPADSTTLTTAIQTPDQRATWDMVFNYGGAEGLGPSNSAQDYGCENPTPNQAVTGYLNCELVALFDEARATLDATAKDEIYHQIASILSDDLPKLALYASELTHVGDARLTGVAVPPFERWAFLDVETWDIAD